MHDEIFPDFPKVAFIDQKRIYISSLFHSQPIDRTGDGIFCLCVLTADERIFRVGFLSSETLQGSIMSSTTRRVRVHPSTRSDSSSSTTSLTLP